MTLTELYDIADSNDIDVDYFPMREVVSCSFSQGIVAIDVDKIDTSIQEKVYLAHELGHCITGSFYNQHSPCDIRERHECRANKWAFHNLLPYEQLMCAAEKGYTEVWQIAELFSLPYEFTAKAIDYYASENL